MDVELIVWHLDCQLGWTTNTEKNLWMDMTIVCCPSKLLVCPLDNHKAFEDSLIQIELQHNIFFHVWLL